MLFRSAYLLLLQYDDAITIEQCTDMSISEIYALIQQLQQEENVPQEEEFIQEEELSQEELPQEELPQEEELQVPEENAMDDLNNIPTHDQGEQHHHGGHH